MKFNALFLPFFAVLALANLAPISAFAITTEPYILRCQNLLTLYSDSYTKSEELKNYWKIHPRFGILKRGSKFILITKTTELSLSLQQELISWTQSLGETVASPVKELKTSPIKNSVAVDVTGILPKIAREMHERFANKVNCWSFACHLADVSGGLYWMNGPNFRFWLESPLSRKLGAEEELRAGDIIAYRTTEQEQHAAVYVSENLVLSKNGAEESPLRLQDTNEVSGLYYALMTRRFNYKITIEAYRFKPLKQYIDENKNEISEELSDALKIQEKIDELSLFTNLESEIDVEKLPEAEFEAYQEKYRKYRLEAINLKRNLRALAQAGLKSPALTKAQEFLWTALLARSNVP